MKKIVSRAWILRLVDGDTPIEYVDENEHSCRVEIRHAVPFRPPNRRYKPYTITITPGHSQRRKRGKK
jgi:hypothetical protein